MEKNSLRKTLGKASLLFAMAGISTGCANTQPGQRYDLTINPYICTRQIYTPCQRPAFTNPTANNPIHRNTRSRIIIYL